MKIVIDNGKIKKEVNYKKKESVLDVLRDNEISITSNCNGKGTCGKCKVKLINATSKPTVTDNVLLNEAELLDGYRLACKTQIEDNMVINCTEIDYDYSIINNTIYNINKNNKTSDNYGIAIDIGTTTVAMSLVDIDNTCVIDNYSFINKQRNYGADVVSRIEYATKGNLNKLNEIIINDLLNGIKKLVNNKQKKIKHIAISGNTVMEHILMKEPVDSLGTFPFEPNISKMIEKPFEELFNSDFLNCDVIIMPVISGYIGGDSVSSIYYTNIHLSNRGKMIIDIGTNSEIIVGSKNNIKCTAAAAGPAFEGGNIGAGVGSVSGAIDSLVYKGRKFKYSTINNISPIGICGSAIIDFIAEGLRNNWISSEGKLENEYNNRDVVIGITDIGKPIIITQNDIREIQLAKSAIYTGIKLLLEEIDINKIEEVYIAGGMGTNINLESAFRMKLLPKELESKVVSIGNSSLGGAIKLILNIDTGKKEIKKIAKTAKSLLLGEIKEFESEFINNIDFK